MTGPRWWLPGAAVAAVLGVVLLVGLGLGIGRNTASGGYSLEGLPPETVLNYEYAAAHPEHASRIPCYCGCESLEHRSLLDCFVKPDGGWEPHATYCGVCRQEATEMEAMLNGGASIESVRIQIDERFGGLGRPTNTP